ncbi:hypothetical protein ACS0TY_004741 [Phlomoides rotata]
MSYESCFIATVLPVTLSRPLYNVQMHYHPDHLVEFYKERILSHLTTKKYVACEKRRGKKKKRPRTSSQKIKFTAIINLLPPLRRRHPPLLSAPAAISTVRHPLPPLAATPPRRSQLVNGFEIMSSPAETGLGIYLTLSLETLQSNGKYLMYRPPEKKFDWEPPKSDMCNQENGSYVVEESGSSRQLLDELDIMGELFSVDWTWTQYNAIINAAELTRYVQVKQTILKLPGFTENVVTHLFAGLGAGFFAVCIGLPVDVEPDVICTEGVSHNREKMHSLLHWVSDGRIEMRITW